MEIKFELENSDIECVFTPDFRVSANYTDQTKVSWRLPNRKSSLNVEMRGMWAFCVTNFKLKAPYTPPFLVAQMCDCYIDEMRMSHPHSHINKLSDNETREMGMRLIRTCNVYPEAKST